MKDAPVRETTWEERSTWGMCPVCKAEHGQRCNSDVGIMLGSRVASGRPADGAHLGRIQNAPLRVRLVAA